MKMLFPVICAIVGSGLLVSCNALPTPRATSTSAETTEAQIDELVTVSDGVERYGHALRYRGRSLLSALTVASQQIAAEVRASLYQAHWVGNEEIVPHAAVPSVEAREPTPSRPARRGTNESETGFRAAVETGAPSLEERIAAEVRAGTMSELFPDLVATSEKQPIRDARRSPHSVSAAIGPEFSQPGAQLAVLSYDVRGRRPKHATSNARTSAIDDELCQSAVCSGVRSFFAILSRVLSGGKT